MTQFVCKDLTRGEENAILKVVGTSDTIRKILSGELRIQLLSTTSEVVVSAVEEQILIIPADASFEDRISRGNYGYHNPDLTEKKFPVNADQVGEWEYKLFHFDRDISSDKAIELMRAEGFEPGAIGHILTFGETNPEEQRKYPIVGLGSVAVVDLERLVPVLWVVSGRRNLDLFWYDDGWGRYYRFLGVRRRSVA